MECWETSVQIRVEAFFGLLVVFDKLGEVGDVLEHIIGYLQSRGGNLSDTLSKWYVVRLRWSGSGESPHGGE